MFQLLMQVPESIQFPNLLLTNSVFVRVRQPAWDKSAPTPSRPWQSGPGRWTVVSRCRREANGGAMISHAVPNSMYT